MSLWRSTQYSKGATVPVPVPVPVPVHENSTTNQHSSVLWRYCIRMQRKKQVASVVSVPRNVKSFRTGRRERELQMVQLSTTRCSCIAILWVSLVSFAAITLYVASQRVLIVVSVYFVIDSVRKLLDTPSYFLYSVYFHLNRDIRLQCLNSHTAFHEH
jgi:hypothetical protein